MGYRTEEQEFYSGIGSTKAKPQQGEEGVYSTIMKGSKVGMRIRRTKVYFL